MTTRLSRIIPVCLAAFFSVFLFAGSPAQAALVLIKSYDFNGDLTDTLGNGNDLTSFGGNLTTPGRYTFAAGQGLDLSDAFPDPTDYAIEMRFEIDSNIPFWKKIIDYQDLTSDNGAYIRSSSLAFLSPGTALGGTGIPSNTDAVIRITRDGGTNEVQGFVNGNLEFSFFDTALAAVSVPNLLTFFVDDAISGGTEVQGGSVDYIRIFSEDNIVVSEPGPFAVLSIGLAGLVMLRRCKPC